MLTKKLSIVLILIIFIIIQISATHIQTNNIKTCLSSTCAKEAENILNTIDESVSPCDDFYQFSCGKWLESTVIPDHRSSVNRFFEVQQELNKKLRDMLEKVSLNSENRDFVIKAKNYYESCLNTSLIEKLGDKPLVDLLKQLNEWPIVLETKWTETHWTDLYIKLRKLGLSYRMLFSLSVETDIQNNSRNILTLDHPMLALSREYLLKGLNDSAVSAYRNLMFKSAVKLGANKYVVNQTIDDMLSFETSLANFSMSREERRNLSLVYNKMTIKELSRISTHIDWLKIIRNFVSDSITENDEIVLYDMPFIKSLDSLLNKTNNRLLANYIIWRVIHTKLSSLSSDWIEIKAQFESAVYGTKSVKPRPEECLAAVDLAMSMSLSHLYVKNFFNEDNREKALEMVSNVKNEFRNTLNSNDWMKGQTLVHALKKLENMRLLVGYPEELLNETNISAYYEKLNINSKDYFGNRQSLSKWATDLSFNTIYEPNDIYDWRQLSDVAEVNAYYHQEKNMVVIPAGILQGIFYNKDRPNYLNYGTIGKSAGHEIIHAFDDNGRQYDENGNLNNWWDQKTDRLYRDKAQCFVDKYSNITVKPIGLKINGKNTLGENLADNGGIKHAFRAYLNSIKNTGSEQLLPGLKYTPEQLFWISYGVHYCSKHTNEILKLIVQTDPHTPNRERINGVLSNSEDFSKAFNCPIGSPMNPTFKCLLW